jgi:hypothetical protein
LRIRFCCRAGTAIASQALRFTARPIQSIHYRHAAHLHFAHWLHDFIDRLVPEAVSNTAAHYLPDLGTGRFLASGYGANDDIAVRDQPDQLIAVTLELNRPQAHP